MVNDISRMSLNNLIIINRTYLNSTILQSRIHDHKLQEDTIKMAVSSDFYSLVCAIDFGTTFSGYSYSPKIEYDHDPLNISVPNWDAPSSVQISYKTPTTLLLDKDKNFVAFGYEAENAYAELAEDEENEDYFYIRRFKMLLYDTLKKHKKQVFVITF